MHVELPSSGAELHVVKVLAADLNAILGTYWHQLIAHLHGHRRYPLWLLRRAARIFTRRLG